MSSYLVADNNNLLDAVTTNTTSASMYIQDKNTKNLYIAGTAFGGGSVIFQWSIDNINWNTASDPSGNPISTNAPVQYTSLALYGAYYRAVFTGSSGTTNVSVRLV